MKRRGRWKIVLQKFERLHNRVQTLLTCASTAVLVVYTTATGANRMQQTWERAFQSSPIKSLTRMRVPAIGWKETPS
jgi:hypothetical protein